jgi:D-alanyl-D-alanine carboxypeptidase
MRERYEFPGATAAYVWVDGPAGAAATGWADVEAGRPMTTTSRMLAASIGKTVVGATAAALAAEGVVDLDAPVARWLGDRPWFAGVPNHDRITLRHLLTHRSGLPDHVHLPAFAEALSRRWAAPGRPFSPEELVQFVGGHPPLFEAGTDWAYSDTGFLLAGLVLEAATGRDYYDLVQARFLGPLGLDDTAPSTRRALAGLATGYAADNAFGFPRRTTRPDGVLRWSPALEWTGGGLVSTAPDLARWGAALFGGEALSAAARARMLDAVPIAPGASDVGYGLGVAVAPSGPHGPVYGHGGWIPGYVSSLRYYEAPGVAVAFQINTDIGITDDTSAVVPALEARLAAVVIAGRRLGPTAGDAAPR